MANRKNTYLRRDEDGSMRCWWSDNHDDYRHYHDEEWGHPVTNDFKLFEKICLEGFQSGLSWLTILRKRENFRKAFAGFDFNKIARFKSDKVDRLLEDSGIVRHRGKIEATLNNAQRALDIVDEFGSLSSYIWAWEPKAPEPHMGKGEHKSPVPSITKTSIALSSDLKKRGWKFFGSTTAYAFMQAMGLVNDHIEGCTTRELVEAKRRERRKSR